MSETLAAMRALGFVADGLSSRGIALPEEPETEKLLRSIGATEASPSAPPGDFLEEIRRQLVAASQGRRLTGLSGKDLRYAPWLLWNGDPPVASLPGLLPVILDQARTSGPTLRRLIHAYLRDFSSRAPGIGEASECIRRQLRRDDPRLASWCRAQEEVRLFDATKGPALFATRLLGEAEPDTVFARYNFDQPMLMGGGYMMAVEDAVRSAIPVILHDRGTAALKGISELLHPPRTGSGSSRVVLRPRGHFWRHGSPGAVNPHLRCRSRSAGICFTGWAIHDCGRSRGLRSVKRKPP